MIYDGWRLKIEDCRLYQEHCEISDLGTITLIYNVPQIRASRLAYIYLNFIPRSNNIQACKYTVCIVIVTSVSASASALILLEREMSNFRPP